MAVQRKKTTVLDYMKMREAGTLPKSSRDLVWETVADKKPEPVKAPAQPTAAPQPKPQSVTRPPSTPQPMTGVSDATKMRQRSENEIMQSIVEQSLKQKLGDTLDQDAISLLAKRQLSALQTPAVDQEAQVREALKPIIAAQQQKQSELEARIASERQTRLRDREEQLRLLDERLSREAERASARARESAAAQTAITERTMGAAGNLTGTPGQQQLTAIQKDLEMTQEIIDATKNQQLALERAKLEGLDREVIDKMTENLTTLKDQENQFLLDMEGALLEMKQSALEQGDLANQQLVQSLMDGLTTTKVKNEFDKDLTATMGDGFVYGTDDNGQPRRLTDVEGNFLTYSAPSELEDLLSVTEAEKLGVPYGTTREGALGLMPVEKDRGEWDPDRVLTLKEAEDFKVPAGTTLGEYAKIKREQKVDTTSDFMNLVEEIITDEAFKTVVGPASSKLPSLMTLTGKPGDLVKKIDRVKNLVTLDNLDLMSGVLSESDIKILREGGTLLDRTMREDNFTKEAMRLYDNALKEQYNMLGITDMTFEKALDSEQFGGSRAKLRDFINQNMEQKLLEPVSLSQDFSESLSMDGKGSVSSIADGSKVSTKIGGAVATGIQQGSREWPYGLDLVVEGGYGANVKAPFSGKVTYAGPYQGFGNQVRVQLADGKEVWLSHLKDIKVKAGDSIKAGLPVGTQGNTGNVIGGSGEDLTEAQKRAGRGTHLDITVRRPDGSYLSSQQVAQLINTQIA